MISEIKNYYSWLHGQWPDRDVEKQPLVNADGTTNIKGVYIVGDLTGVPLLKFFSDTLAANPVQMAKRFKNVEIIEVKNV